MPMLLMGKRESGGVFKGKDGYLLEDIKTADEEQMENNLSAIRKFQESYPDIPMYMMLVPNAANVLSDKLPGLCSDQGSGCRLPEDPGGTG